MSPEELITLHKAYAEIAFIWTIFGFSTAFAFCGLWFFFKAVIGRTHISSIFKKGFFE